MAQTYLIQFSIDYIKKFLNWLSTSCVVFITTVATWHFWTGDFWADFEQHIIDRAINEWQNDCGAVSVPKDCIRTRELNKSGMIDSVFHHDHHHIWYCRTFYYFDRNTVCLKDLPFLFIRQYKLWNDAQLRITMVTCFSRYVAANTTVF